MVKILLFIVILLTGFNANAERVIAKYMSFVALLPDDEECDDQVQVVVQNDKPNAFLEDRLALQKISGAVRIALEFECKSVKEIRILGKGLSNENVYQGLMAKVTNWKLIDTVTTNVVKDGAERTKEGKTEERAESTIIADSAITDCEGLISPPDASEDGQGLPLILNVPHKSLRICKLALSKDSANAKLQYLYARALHRAGSETEAFKWYSKAAEQNYAAAYLGLGYLYLYGVGAEQSNELAVKYFDLAAQQNIRTAETILEWMRKAGRI